MGNEKPTGEIERWEYAFDAARMFRVPLTMTGGVLSRHGP